MLKTVVQLNIFVETVTHFSGIFDEQHLFETEIFCNIDTATVTFDQFNAYSLK